MLDREQIANWNATPADWRVTPAGVEVDGEVVIDASDYASLIHQLALVMRQREGRTGPAPGY